MTIEELLEPHRAVIAGPFEVHVLRDLAATIERQWTHELTSIGAFRLIVDRMMAMRSIAGCHDQEVSPS